MGRLSTPYRVAVGDWGKHASSDVVWVVVQCCAWLDVGKLSIWKQMAAADLDADAPTSSVAGQSVVSFVYSTESGSGLDLQHLDSARLS